MSTFAKVAGVSALGFVALMAWIACVVGMGALVQSGWDGGDLIVFGIFFVVAVSSTAGAVTLAVRKPKREIHPLNQTSLR